MLTVLLIIEKAAQKGFARMQPKARESMIARLHAIAADPLAHHPNIERMQGLKQGFRLRQGGWRAVYWLSFEEGEMHVTKIDVRGEIYR